MRKTLWTLALATAGLVGCASNRAPDVAGNIRNSLKQAGLNNITVSQDREKRVVTLSGNVYDDASKARAEQIATRSAEGDVVADEIAVVPKGNESNAKAVSADLDKGIEANLDAAFRQAHVTGVRHNTKNGVVTLKGNVATLAARAQAEATAVYVPNVRQVINELDVKNQPATSSSADRSLK
jgi:hyperosmotically inducible protein